MISKELKKKFVARIPENVFVEKVSVDHVVINVCQDSMIIQIASHVTVHQLEVHQSHVTIQENVTVFQTLPENNVQVVVPVTINILNVCHVIVTIMAQKVFPVTTKANVHVNQTLMEKLVMSAMKDSIISQLVKNAIVIQLVLLLVSQDVEMSQLVSSASVRTV